MCSTSPVVDRLNHELGIIKAMGYAGYFLIVQDFTTAARDLGVSVGPGRGSAAGSAVAYCLGVTNIDPLKYGLLFERFLNPERVSMPDIDIDFDDRGRATVIDYVIQKYGRENVCQIITFGTMGARSVIRDVARVLDIPLPEADRIAKMIPEGPKVSLASAMADVQAFGALKDDPNAQIRKLMHYAEVLEGSARHTGVHAAGVIIAPGTVSDYVPVAIAKSKGDPVLTTQYDGNWVEKFGLLKMDFLGLSTLTVLKDAISLIKENHGVDIDLDALPLDDEKTFELFQRGETIAIFQFESEGMREWMIKLKPTRLDDLIAMNALYRPGPMDLIPNYIKRKHGQEEIDYMHPMLEPVLENTFGIPVYQEQVMQMAQVMGGFSLGKADVLRRGMGKKKKEVVDSMYPEFLQGAKERDVPEKTANEVWEMMAKFSGYGFNKSHSAAYSLVAYHTAYLKAHYPAEFMAAAMTNAMGDVVGLDAHDDRFDELLAHFPHRDHVASEDLDAAAAHLYLTAHQHDLVHLQIILHLIDDRREADHFALPREVFERGEGDGFARPGRAALHLSDDAAEAVHRLVATGPVASPVASSIVVASPVASMVPVTCVVLRLLLLIVLGKSVRLTELGGGEGFGFGPKRSKSLSTSTISSTFR